ncbi:hypothetical protein BSZ21_02235 [Bradyrhizobium canariense]|nr:hypothetical protein BSZ21_02235 [Bradyrhizobium canariense]
MPQGLGSGRGLLHVRRGSRGWLPSVERLKALRLGRRPKKRSGHGLVIARWRIRSLPFAAEIAGDDAVVAIDCNLRRRAAISGSCRELFQDLAGLARGLAPAKFLRGFSSTGGQASDAEDKYQRKDCKRDQFHRR